MLPTQDMGFPVCNQLTDYYFLFFLTVLSTLSLPLSDCSFLNGSSPGSLSPPLPPVSYGSLSPPPVSNSPGLLSYGCTRAFPYPLSPTTPQRLYIPPNQNPAFFWSSLHHHSLCEKREHRDGGGRWRWTTSTMCLVCYWAILLLCWMFGWFSFLGRLVFKRRPFCNSYVKLTQEGLHSFCSQCYSMRQRYMLSGILRTSNSDVTPFEVDI